jgi:hypothetical protein
MSENRPCVICIAIKGSRLTSANDLSVPISVHEAPPNFGDWSAGEVQPHGLKPNIKSFDLSRTLKSAKVFEVGQTTELPYGQFLMGVQNAMPAASYAIDIRVHSEQLLIGDASRCTAGIGAQQIDLNERAFDARAATPCKKCERPKTAWRETPGILERRQVAA